MREIRKNFEVISTLDPIGNYAVSLVKDSKGLYFRVSKGDLVFPCYDQHDLSHLRAFSECKVRPEMSFQEANEWRDVMVECRFRLSEISSSYMDRILEETWWERFKRAVKEFLIPPVREEDPF